MTEAGISFAGNLTDDPELRHTEAGIARATFRVAVSGRREQAASFFPVVVWRVQADHAAQSLSRGRACGWATATTTRTTRSQAQASRGGS
jgi:single-strand DNA-binding protein